MADYIVALDRQPLIKVNRWNPIDLKSTLDQALKETLIKGCGYDETNTHLNWKLLISFGSTLIAIFAGLCNYIHPLSHIRHLLAVCVLTYFSVNGLYILYCTYIEADIIFEGRKHKQDKSPAYLRVHASLKRSDGVYVIRLIAQHAPFDVSTRVKLIRQSFLKNGNPSRIASQSRHQKSSELEARADERGIQSEASVGEFFDAKGTFAADIFAKYVMSLQKTSLQST